MPHWNSRGLRGSSLEELINFTNERYRRDGLALLQKIPTPIVPVQIDPQSRNITLAYFEKTSTVDYIGAAQEHLPLQNIHAHQIAFLDEFQKQRGLSFLLVHFSVQDEYFLLPFATLKAYWEAAEQGGRKSIPYEAFEQKYQIPQTGGALHYLNAVSLYLEEIENGQGSEELC